MQIRVIHVSGGWAGRREVFSGERITFGRAADNDVRLSPQDVRASAHHAVLLVSEEGLLVEDLQSTNGTYVNGVRVWRAPVRSGDLLQFGRRGPCVRIEIVAPESPEIPQTEPTLVDLGTSPSAWRVGYATVQMMIEQALRRSSRLWWRWTLGFALGVMVVIGLILGWLWRGERVRPSAPEPENVFSQIAERQGAAVVLIQHHFRLLDARGREISSAVSEGSGFALDPRGLIATNYHLVRPWEFEARFAGESARAVSQSLRVIFANRSPAEALDARLVRGSPEMDLALLKVDAPGPFPAVRELETDLSRLRQGDEVAIIGFPLGSALLQTTGQPRATTTLIRSTLGKVSPTLLQLDAPVIQGYSGSPIFNREGKVIGIVTARLSEREGLMDPSIRSIGLGTPARFLAELLKEVP